MDKLQCQEISDLFDQVEFIERLEKMANNQGAIGFAAVLAQPVRCFDPRHLYKNSSPISIPRNIGKVLYEALQDYKEELKDLLENLEIIDSSEYLDPDEGDEEDGGGEDEEETDEPEDEDDEGDVDEDQKEAESNKVIFF